MFGAWERQNNNQNLICLLLLKSQKQYLAQSGELPIGFCGLGAPVTSLPCSQTFHSSQLLEHLPS